MCTRVGVVFFAVLAAVSGTVNADPSGRTHLRGPDEATNVATFCDPANPRPAPDVTAGGSPCGLGSKCMQRLSAKCTAAGVAGASGVGLIPPEGLSWQASVIGALGNIIAERSKAEVTAWVESVVSNRLCSLKSPATIGGPVTEQWFKNTCRILEDKDLGVQKATGLLASSLRQDLVTLPQAVALWWFNNHKQQAAIGERLIHDFAVLDRFLGGMDKGEPLLELVANLGHDDDLTSECVATSAAEAGQVTPECALVFAGLLVEHFGGVVTFSNITTNLGPNNFETLFTAVFAGDKLCQAVNQAFQGSRTGHNPAAAAPPAGTTCQLLPAVPVAIQKYVTLLNQADADFDKYKARIFALTRDMVNLEIKLRALKDKPQTLETLVSVLGNLDQVINSGLRLFDDTEAITGYSRYSEIVLSIFRLGTYIISKQYSAAGSELLNLVNMDELRIELPAGFKRFLAFTLDVAEAKNSDDVQHAIEMVAAPLGGWKVKHDRFTIALTALPGAIGGGEFALSNSATQTPPMGDFSSGAAAGLFAPLGVDFAGPLCDKLAAGVFVSVLDLGQLTWSRLSRVTSDKDVSASVTPETDFAQIVSPGVYFHLSAGKSPFVFGLGASFAPALRAYSFTNNGAQATVPLDVIRIGGFVAIDVTLLPFWARK